MTFRIALDEEEAGTEQQRHQRQQLLSKAWQQSQKLGTSAANIGVGASAVGKRATDHKRPLLKAWGSWRKEVKAAAEKRRVGAEKVAAKTAKAAATAAVSAASSYRRSPTPLHRVSNPLAFPCIVPSSGEGGGGGGEEGGARGEGRGDRGAESGNEGGSDAGGCGGEGGGPVRRRLSIVSFLASCTSASSH